MSRPRPWLIRTYQAIALLALVACWHQNLRFMAAPPPGLEGVGGFVTALLMNAATTSITLDLLLCALAAMIWMVVEARRLRIRLVWAYLAGALLLAISVTFPLFLAARERALERDGVAAPALAPGELAGLALLGLPTAALSVWSLFA